MNENSSENIKHSINIEIVDKRGSKISREVNPETCLGVLKEVMEIENDKEEYDYNLRVKLLKLSEGKLSTWQVFIKDPAFIDRIPGDACQVPCF